MNTFKYIFNPFSGNFEQVIIPLTRQEVVSSILLATDPDTQQLDIMFDEDSILYVDDDYIE